MLDEIDRLQREYADTPPDDTAMSIVATSDNPTRLLCQTKEVWTVVARFGRYFEEYLGDWPPDEVVFAQLPDWARAEIPYIQDRFVDINEREWIWWNCVSGDNFVKVDLYIEAFPTSSWIMVELIEALGGNVVYRDDWISLDSARKLVP